MKEKAPGDAVKGPVPSTTDGELLGELSGNCFAVLPPVGISVEGDMDLIEGVGVSSVAVPAA